MNEWEIKWKRKEPKEDGGAEKIGLLQAERIMGGVQYNASV